MRGLSLNPNKFFPRLSITAKLVVAFLLVAGAPLLVVAGVGMVGAARQLTTSVRETISHDLALAKVRTERSLREIEQHIAFLDEVGLSALLRDGEGHEAAAVVARRYLQTDSSALFRVKALTADGAPALIVARDGESSTEGDSEPLYAWLGSSLPPGSSAFLPVELRREGGG